jgi:hypothetical protein
LELGLLAHAQGDYASARLRYEESLATDRELKLNQHVAFSLCYLAYLARHEGDASKAQTLLRSSLGLQSDIHDKRSTSLALVGVAGLSNLAGRMDRAARLLSVAKRVLTEAQYAWEPVERTEYEDTLVKVRAQLDSQEFATAWAEGRAMTLDQAVVYALAEMPTTFQKEE